MLMPSLPGIVAPPPPGSSRWTAEECPRPFFFVAPTRIRSPIGRKCRVGSPSASLDIQSNIDGANLRTGDELRFQLDHLQAEAESTRSKATSARMRLLRLSEVAEQLQKQAVSKVKAGKEDDARDLLLQKKKILHALEKSKNRIELLDKLSAKLNEAILLKETELIGNVSSHAPVTMKDMNSPVRVVPPKTIEDEESQESEAFESLSHNTAKIRDMEPQKYQVSNSMENVESHVEVKPIPDTLNTGIDTFLPISTYTDFLEHVDVQLEGLQDDLLAFQRLSNLVTKNELIQKNKNLQDIIGILQDISTLRKRITRIIQSQDDEISHKCE